MSTITSTDQHLIVHFADNPEFNYFKAVSLDLWGSGPVAVINNRAMDVAGNPANAEDGGLVGIDLSNGHVIINAGQHYGELATDLVEAAGGEDDEPVDKLAVYHRMFDVLRSAGLTVRVFNRESGLNCVFMATRQARG
jgi:hypothetical protein